MSSKVEFALSKRDENNQTIPSINTSPKTMGRSYSERRPFKKSLEDSTSVVQSISAEILPPIDQPIPAKDILTKEKKF